MRNETFSGEKIVEVVPGGRYEIQATGVVVVVGVTSNGSKRWSRVLGSTDQGRLSVEIVPREERVRVLCDAGVEWKIRALFGTKEEPDKTPVELPVRLRNARPDDMRQLIREEFARLFGKPAPASESDHEDDYEDFTDDEDSPLSGYEVIELPEDEGMVEYQREVDKHGESERERSPRVRGEDPASDEADVKRAAASGPEDEDSPDGEKPVRPAVRSEGGDTRRGAARRPS